MTPQDPFSTSSSNRNLFIALIPATLLVGGTLFVLNLIFTKPKSSAQKPQEAPLKSLKKIDLSFKKSKKGGVKLSKKTQTTLVPGVETVYCLPFLRGNSYTVSQGYGGPTHQGSDYYAVDFVMPEGTPVYAVQEGIVMRVEQNFTDRGLTDDLKTKANAILVRHNDGTVANYGHLQKRGSIVQQGQKIQKRQLIGYSGNTGYSTGPHLHFAILREAKDHTYEGIPSIFRTVENDYTTLETGKRYTAPVLCE